MIATAFNKTTAHLVNKIKFFIHADNVKTNFKLKNIVGFTDTRENYRPFHVLKYIADNYVEDYGEPNIDKLQRLMQFIFQTSFTSSRTRRI